jgi:hypothetical protein
VVAATGGRDRAELDRFRRDYPEVARRLAHLLDPAGPAPLPSGALFDLGQVTFPTALAAGDLWTALTSRHMSGDHGVFGPHRDLDEQQVPIVEAFGIPARNAAAIASGDGLVLARFPAWPAGEWADVATLLVPGRPSRTTLRIGCQSRHELD